MARLAPRWLRSKSGWLAVFAILAVFAANLRAIAVARRGALEEAERAFASEVAARAREIESRLTALRADLAFVAASSPLARLGEGAEVDWRRAGAESALLLFLRSHPEVVRIVVRSATGDPLIHTGRRGGVPLLWVAANPTGREGAAVAPGRTRLLTRVAWRSGEHGGGETTLEAELEPTLLLGDGGGETARCRLEDAHGSRLVPVTPESRERPPSEAVRGQAVLRVEGWTAPSPWRLECTQPEALAVGRVAPVAARYRTTLALNVAVMGLATLLGGFAVQQARHRERLEEQARQEARVRALERQLFHAERLTTVGRLAAGIAHEINNPLEGMSNWLSLAREALEAGRTEAAEAHLARVREGLERAAGIVRQVLAHADPAQAPFAELDLNDVLRDTGRFVESRKEFGGVRFAFALADEPLLVHGSAVMLGQVAVNLVLNACEAQQGAGEVEVRSRRDSGNVIAEFADRGPGVGEADRVRIFEPFFTTKDSTGLGLSICHTIVRQHGGELGVAPREGGGAVFSMRLPGREAAAREAAS